jgi:hypothetical protein
MKPYSLPFQLTNWETIPYTEHPGETGMARWRTWESGGLRMRMVEYSANYKADHWCEQGHLVFCLAGEVISEMKTGEQHILRQNSSYQVSDGLSSHRSISSSGATFLIIDGSFLERLA